jgi:hypothetical protein
MMPTRTVQRDESGEASMSDDDRAATYVHPGKLRAWSRNPRKGKPVAEVAESIKRFGFAAPIVARMDGTVIAGHTRLEAALSLGLDRVPVRFLDLDEQEAAALALADNRLSELAEWDADGLSGILAELEQASVPIDGLGWDAEALRDLLGSGEPTTEPTDDAPAVDDRVVHSRLGEVYELGPHRLVCGDSTDDTTWRRLLGNERLQMVWTDPPYGMSLGVEYDRMHSHEQHRKTGPRFRPVIGDDAPFDASPCLARVADVPEQFWWGADYYRSHLPDGGSWLVWDKRDNDAGMDLDAVIGGQFELCWSKVKHRREIARVLWSGHHGMQGVDAGPRVHPTQKPVELARWFFRRWGAVGEIVGDLFGGSGTTLIACALEGRVARLIELDPRYCDVIRRRWTRWARENGQDPGPGGLDDAAE